MRASSPPSELEHVLLIEDPAGQQAVVLTAPTYVIGREPTCSIVLRAACVSRQHASLVRISGPNGYHYRIFDGNSKGKRSKNGLLIGGEKVSSWDLSDGDTIQFGEFTTATYRIATTSELAIHFSSDRAIAAAEAEPDDATVYLQ